MAEGVKKFLIQNKKYVIYEHDHKYLRTRDPSKFNNFIAPEEFIINREFYEGALATVVLSQICKDVLIKNLPKVNIHNIGCSLWSDYTFEFLKKKYDNKKTEDLCIMKSGNPTKNYHNTVKFCNENGLNYKDLPPTAHHDFLTKMSDFKRFLFIPTVLETFSRICAEAKMMNLDVMTNRKMIGFFSEKNSNLKGLELIESLQERNKKALEFFEELI